MSVEQQPSVPVVEPMKKKKKNNNHKNSLKALLSKPKAQQNMTNSNLSDFLSSL